MICGEGWTTLPVEVGVEVKVVGSVEAKNRRRREEDQKEAKKKQNKETNNATRAKGAAAARLDLFEPREQLS